MTIWTHEEVKRYQPLDNKFLNDLYETRGISKDHPEERAKFLSSIIPLTMTDHDVLMSYARNNGRACSLNMLERFTITYFTPLFHLER